MSRRENEYQASLIEKLEDMFSGCMILKNDTSYKQGIPDLSIFWREFWAVLEVKASASAPRQPNQEYYIETLDEMFFAAIIYPENEEEVLNALQQAFKSPRRARVS